MDDPRIGDFFELPKMDYEQPDDFTWKEFYNFRNELLRVLRRFGTAGPMGEVDLSADEEDSPVFRDDHVRSPDFFVVDDMYNMHDKLQLVECNPFHVTTELLRDLRKMAWLYPGWWTQFSFGDSALRVSADTILVGGRRFWDVTGEAEVGNRCSRTVDFEEPAPFSEPMYQMWLRMIGGNFDASTNGQGATEREWVEAVRVMRELAGRHTAKRNNHFDYSSNISSLLHPQIRREHLLRAMDDIAHGTLAFTEEVSHNLVHDAAASLVASHGTEERAFLACKISLLQQGLIGMRAGKQVFLWWASVMTYARKGDAELRRVLVEEMFTISLAENPAIKLSGIFGLAQLQVDGLASVIDEAIKANPQWAEKQELFKWLNGLRAGRASFPLSEALAQM